MRHNIGHPNRGVCSGIFAPALVPVQRVNGTRKYFCPGTKRQWEGLSLVSTHNCVYDQQKQFDFVSYNYKLHSRNLPYSSRHQHQRQNGVFLSHMTEHSRTSQLATLIIKSIGASFLLLMLAACGQDAAPTLLFIIHVGGSGGANCFSQTRERSFSYAQENISLPNISCGFSTL